MNDLLVLQTTIAKVAALIDERAPHDELDRAWSIPPAPVERDRPLHPHKVPADDLPPLSLPDDG